MKATTIRTHWYLINCFIVATMISANSLFAASVADFSVYSLLDQNGNVLLPGRLYVPPAASPGDPRPLMVFLHGSGADGTDDVSQLNQVPDEMVTEAMQQGDFLYAPQTDGNWNSSTISGYVMSMVERAVSQENADTSRLFITGYSIGGGGTWDILSRYPGKFAAAITLSGVTAAPDFVAAHLLGTPLFVLHARDDTTAAVSNSRNVVDGILAADGQPLPNYLGLGNSSLFVFNPSFAIDQQFDAIIHQQGPTVDFTISDPNLDLMYYEASSGGHNTLGALDSPEPYEWLLSHSLAVPEPTALALMVPAAVVMIVVRRRRKKCCRSE
jgi:predicted peptidase